MRRLTRGTQLGDREAFYRNVVHSLRNGVIAVWRDGSIAVVNDAAYRGDGCVAERHRLAV
jgi:hypothetical protein